MAHISELGLFDYLAGTADLTAQEIEHLQDCDDCSELAVDMRRIIQDSPDISKARCLLVEEGERPSPEEPPKDVHEEQQ